MKTKERLIIAIAGSAPVLLFFFLDLPSMVAVLTAVLTITIMVLWMLVGHVGKLLSQEKEFKNRLASIQEETPSYELEMEVFPRWEKIFEVVAKSDSTTVEEVIAESRAQVEAGKIPGLGARYRFVVFYDGQSGLEAIWSEPERTFVSSPTISVRLFEWEFGTLDHRLIRQELEISPYCVRFHNRDLGFHNSLGTVPVGLIRQLLVDINKRSSTATNYTFIAFPPKLQEEFDRTGASYQQRRLWERYREGRIESEIESDPVIEHDDQQEPYFNSTDWAKKVGVQMKNSRGDGGHWFSTEGHQIHLTLRVFHRREEKYNSYW
ncbi:MAG: hypothetical protein JJE04_20990 [Acidobacteriia bacterium]|nr:hypothetical protein [Terriglobia bacterium]